MWRHQLGKVWRHQIVFLSSIKLPYKESFVGGVVVICVAHKKPGTNEKEIMIWDRDVKEKYGGDLNKDLNDRVEIWKPDTSRFQKVNYREVVEWHFKTGQKSPDFEW